MVRIRLAPIRTASLEPKPATRRCQLAETLAAQGGLSAVVEQPVAPEWQPNRFGSNTIQPDHWNASRTDDRGKQTRGAKYRHQHRETHAWPDVPGDPSVEPAHEIPIRKSELPPIESLDKSVAVMKLEFRMLAGDDRPKRIKMLSIYPGRELDTSADEDPEATDDSVGDGQ